MNLSDVLKASGVSCNLRAKTMEEAVDEMTALLVASGDLTDKDAVGEALHRREKMGTTAVGRGVAIPHATCECVDEMVVVVGVHREGLDFKAPDKKPVHFLIGMVGPPNKPEEHLRMLSHVSRVFRSENLREALLKAETDSRAFDIVIAADRGEMTPTAKPSELQRRKMIMLVLQDENVLDDVMELFIDLGMVGGVVLDTTGIEETVTSRVPLFMDFAGFLGEGHRYSKTIFGIVEERLLDRIVSEIEEVTGPLDKEGGVLAVFDVTLPRVPK